MLLRFSDLYSFLIFDYWRILWTVVVVVVCLFVVVGEVGKVGVRFPAEAVFVD